MSESKKCKFCEAEAVSIYQPLYLQYFTQSLA